jgi:hypothetical protein
MEDFRLGGTGNFIESALEMLWSIHAACPES